MKNMHICCCYCLRGMNESMLSNWVICPIHFRRAEQQGRPLQTQAVLGTCQATQEHKTRGGIGVELFLRDMQQVGCAVLSFTFMCCTLGVLSCLQFTSHHFSF